jgi:hypothetical protein
MRNKDNRLYDLAKDDLKKGKEVAPPLEGW